MTVSVIIPVYNVKPYLERCVRSVLNQTYKDLEIILVDDGSTDGSGDLCDQIAAGEPRVCVVHQQNQGLSGARNTGIQQAIGEYVIFLDSDDEWLLTEGLQKLVQAAEDHPDLVAFKMVDIYGNQCLQSSDYDVESIVKIPSASEVFTYLVYTQRFRMSACPQMIRLQLLKEHDIFFPVGMISEDVFWSMHLWQYLQTVKFTNLNLYGYHHRGASISTTSDIRTYRSYDQIFTYWKGQCDADCKNAKAIRVYMANMWVSIGYGHHFLSSADKPEALAILKKHTDLLRFGNSPKSKRTRKMVSLFGVRLTVGMLGTYWQARSLIKH